MRACYQMRLEKEPKLAGKLMYEIQIGTDGLVTKVKLDEGTTTQPIRILE